MTEPAAQDNTVAVDITAQARPPDAVDSDAVPVTDASPANGDDEAGGSIDPAATPAPDDGAPDDDLVDLATSAPAELAAVIGLLEQAIASLRTLDAQEG